MWQEHSSVTQLQLSALWKLLLSLSCSEGAGARGLGCEKNVFLIETENSLTASRGEGSCRGWGGVGGRAG